MTNSNLEVEKRELSQRLADLEGTSIERLKRVMSALEAKNRELEELCDEKLR